MKVLTILFISIFMTVACNSSGGGSGAATDPTDTVNNTTGANAPQGGDTGDGSVGNNSGDTSGGNTTAGDPNCVEKLGLDKVAQDEVFIGSNDWYSTSQLTDAMMKANAQATVYVRMSGARCSGFLVNEDTIMTNNHCIGSASEAQRRLCAL